MTSKNQTFQNLAESYFNNKRKLKELKEKRRIRHSNCENLLSEGFDDYPTDCIDRYKFNKEEKLCPDCQLRQNAFLEIRKLAQANAGIANKIYHLIEKGEKK